jgi:hypothetical protein
MKVSQYEYVMVYLVTISVCNVCSVCNVSSSVCNGLLSNNEGVTMNLALLKWLMMRRDTKISASNAILILKI